MGDILVNGWFWNRWDTGSGQYLTALLRHWPRTKQEDTPRIHLLVPRRNHGEAVRGPEFAGEDLVLHRAGLGRLPPALAKVWWEQITVPRWGRKLGADLVWHPYWTASLWQPPPQVATIHDVIPAVLPAYRATARQKLYLRLITAATRRTRHVLTVSQAAGRDLEEQLGLARGHISVVPNGVSRYVAPPAAVAAHLRRQHDLPARFFLYVGSFERRKNVAAVLRAFAVFRRQKGDSDMVLVLAGRLPPRDTLVLQDPRPLIAELGLASHVRLLNYVSEAEKAALYGMATALVFPGLYEGFGLMVAEAMQAGTPVITSRS